MKNILCVFFFGLLTCSIYAQNFQVWKGVVRDKNTNLPIDFASVYTKNPTVRLVTNNEGRFRLVLPASYKGGLTIECLGYKKEQLPILPAPNDSLIILLDLEVQDLKELTVSNISAENIMRKIIEKRKNMPLQPAKTFEAFARGGRVDSEWFNNLFASEIRTEQVLLVEFPAIGGHINNKKFFAKYETLKLRYEDKTNLAYPSIIPNLARFPLSLTRACKMDIPIFEKSNLSRYDFYFDTTYRVRDGLSVLAFKPKNMRKNTKNTINGKIVFDDSTMQISHIEFLEKNEVKQVKDREKAQRNLQTRVVVSYQEIDGFYYPAHIKTISYGEEAHKENEELIASYGDKNYSEIFIIKPSNIKIHEEKLNKEVVRRKFKEFYAENRYNNDLFWEEYNAVYPNSYDDEMKIIQPNNGISNILIKSKEVLERIESGKYIVKNKRKFDLKTHIDSSIVNFTRKKYGFLGANICVESEDKIFYGANGVVLEIDKLAKTKKMPRVQYTCARYIFEPLPATNAYFENALRAIKFCKNSLSMEKIAGEEFYVIEIQYPDNKNIYVEKLSEKIFISAKDYMLKKIVRTKYKNGNFLIEEQALEYLGEVDENALDIEKQDWRNYPED